MRLAFMGTPDFAVPVLRALVEAGHEVVRVYTQPPRPAGRGNKLRPSPVHRVAEELGLKVETPASFRDRQVIEGLAPLLIEQHEGLIALARVLVLKQGRRFGE